MLHEARLDLDPSAWQALRDNYLSNEYYAANLSVDGVAVSQVGIRSRGEGSRNQDKPALKVDFNKYVPGQEYYGYKTLVTSRTWSRTRACCASGSRSSCSRRWVSRLRATPSPGSRSTASTGASSRSSSRSRKPFLRSRLGEDSGNLFDYQWSFNYDFSFLGGDTTQYVPLPFEPQTNEDHADVADGLVAFIQTINEAPSAGYAAAMGARIDVDRFLTHVAVENALAEADGLVGDQGLNNFYPLRVRPKNRFVFIPWDKDNTFRSGSWPLYRNLDDDVLTSRLTADPAKRQVYVDAVVRAVTNFVNPRWLTPQLETAYQQIRAAGAGGPAQALQQRRVRGRRRRRARRDRRAGARRQRTEVARRAAARWRRYSTSAGSSETSDDREDHQAEVLLHERQVAEEVAGEEADAHPQDPAHHVVGQEAQVAHRADAGHERRERPHDRDEARDDDRLDRRTSRRTRASCAGGRG